MLRERKNPGPGLPLRYHAGMRPNGPRPPCLGRLLGAVFALFFPACSTFGPVQPLAPGETALGVSLGGPLLQTLGTVFPTPVLTVTAARGLHSRPLDVPWAVTGAADVTAALFGDLHLEPGLVAYPIVRKAGAIPTVAVAGSLHVLANRHDSLFAPHLAGIASWHLSQCLLVYTGADAAMAIKSPAAPIVGPLGGVHWVTGRGRFGLEVKWLAPYHDVEPAAPTWIAPFHHGYFSVLLAAGYHFGGAR
jgi:hypothetical protein